MAAHAMEEHQDAYFAWKRLGIRDAWCWHFDAHLDIGREGLNEARLTALADCQGAEEAARRGVLGNCYLPWGGLHCGNYLTPAIREGMVARLTWVIPPYLPRGDLLTWARQHLDGWFELSLQEYASFREESGRVVGQALGIPMEVGTWDVLAPPETPVLLDVDIDYFLTNDGEVWWEPDEVARTTAGWSSLCTTVAYSVKGGYTPTSQRRLADPFVSAPLDPGYQASPLDEATTLYRCLRYEEAVVALKPLCARYPLEAPYYLGSSYQKLERWQEALEAWQPLCESSAVSDDGKAYLRGLCAEMCLKLGRYEEAIEHAGIGKRLMPGDYRHPWTEALARELQGDGKAAIRLVRRALRLAEDTTFGLRIRLALARLYRRAGQRQLSKAELARLAALDVTGEYRASTVL
jgi:tetratricopeptide (TPR) repeat protein